MAVAAGLAAFALGTDTAGSGRVPASFNNLVGLKPTRGWLSTKGVVPACRSLDCVSIFALTVEDAAAVAEIAGAFDPADSQARRKSSQREKGGGAAFRFGVPAPADLEWLGDPFSPVLFGEAVRRLEQLGGERVEIDFAPFRAAARLLYEGPWLAERWVAIRDFHAGHADAILPVTRQIIEPGAKLTAADAFSAFYELESLRRATEPVWSRIDTLVLPTAATIFTRGQIEKDPIRLNSQLGLYTNFANLLDLAALAVPAGFRPDGIPFGITLFGPAWSDGRLAALGSRFHRSQATTLGATGTKLGQEESDHHAATPDADDSRLLLAVVGAHLSGQPLNPQLTERGGRLVRADRTTDCYRLYALAGTKPAKPGLVRVAPGTGATIEIEIWSLPREAWADFVAAIPAPLGIGTLTLEQGGKVQGFLMFRLEGAVDITSFGGWRAYLRRG